VHLCMAALRLVVVTLAKGRWGSAGSWPDKKTFMLLSPFVWGSTIPVYEDV
jgi:hypothetical protein